jgi:hypothetical protein
LLKVQKKLPLSELKSFLTAPLTYWSTALQQQKNWGEWLEIKENLAFEIKQIVENEKAGFAFPSTSIYHENSPN